MSDYRYLVIGGGMTAASAVEGIREVDRDGSIGLVSAEPDAPYNRPPLSKGLWNGKALGSIWRMTAATGVEMHLGTSVTRLDLKRKCVECEHGKVLSGEKVLLATGGTPRHLPLPGDGVIYFRTLGDYRRLRARSAPGLRVVVIGGGFIGSEVAAALTTNGIEVTMVFAEAGIGGRMFPAGLSRFVSDYYALKGVHVWSGETVTAVEARGERYVVRTGAGREVEANAVVAGLGVAPNVALASQTGLAVGDGIQVDEFLRTSDPSVFAAGDVAWFENPALGTRMRVEHEDNANTMGRMAGRNMAGAEDRYRHLPFFYSDMFDLGYEAVGEVDSRLQIVEDWKTPFREGVIYYLSAGRVRGVMLWNVWGRVDAAREVIGQPGPWAPADLRGRLR